MHQKIYTKPTQHTTLQQNIVETHQQPIEAFYAQEEPEIEVEDEAQKKTNALWKRYGF